MYVIIITKNIFLPFQSPNTVKFIQQNVVLNINVSFVFHVGFSTLHPCFSHVVIPLTLCLLVYSFHD